MISYTLQLNWIKELHALLRNAFTDSFFIGWNYVDSLWFVMLFVGTVMYLMNRKEGVALFFLFILSGVTNTCLKHFFELPRPCHIDSSVAILCTGSFGFPSGAAQTATIVASFCIVHARKNIYKLLGLLFAFLLCFSRIYLGLHYFTDILGGIAVGLVLFAIYRKWFPAIDPHWDKFAFVLTPLIFLIGEEKAYSHAALTFGAGVGLLLLGKKLTLPRALSRRIATYLIVLIGSVTLMIVGEVYVTLKLLTAFLGTFWFIYLGSFIVSMTNPRNHPHEPT